MDVVRYFLMIVGQQGQRVINTVASRLLRGNRAFILRFHTVEVTSNRSCPAGSNAVVPLVGAAVCVQSHTCQLVVTLQIWGHLIVMQRTPVEAESGSSALAMGYLSEQFDNRTIGTRDGSQQTFDATDLWKSLQNGADSLSKYAFDSVRAAGKTCDQVCLPVLHLIEDKL